ncbi:MAG TPA: ASCH domain-containing protein [Usitatibacteraceae bacterium]|nr:ASCH domain-containing protein [Usitatibacteraceae bacterium]
MKNADAASSAWGSGTITTGQVLELLAAQGIVLPPGRLRIDFYGDSPQLSAELLALIGSGRKRAGTSLLWGLEADGESIPAPGDIEVILDHHNRPAFITRTTRVDILPFRAVGSDYARIEGEGDGSLEYWRAGHWAFFSRECARIGREPSLEMPVVCCVFELIENLAVAEP